MRDVIRGLLAIPLSLMWLAIVCVFIAGTTKVATSVLGEEGKERWPVVVFLLVGLGFLVIAANLFLLRLTGFGIGGMS